MTRPTGQSWPSRSSSGRAMNSADVPDRAQDWYSVLGVARAATVAEITAAVERLTRQASALSLTAPERSRQLREQARSIKRDLLSGEAERHRYDQHLARDAQARDAQAAGTLPAGTTTAGTTSAGTTSAGTTGTDTTGTDTTGAGAGRAAGQATGLPAGGDAGSGQGPANHPGQRVASRVARFLQTGWTCPACGHGAMPADKFCQKCGSRIQAIARDNAPSGAAQSAIQSASCGNCGEPLARGHTFCTRCGTPRA